MWTAKLDKLNTVPPPHYGILKQTADFLVSEKVGAYLAIHHELKPIGEAAQKYLNGQITHEEARKQFEAYEPRAKQANDKALRTADMDALLRGDGELIVEIYTRLGTFIRTAHALEMWEKNNPSPQGIKGGDRSPCGLYIPRS